MSKNPAHPHAGALTVNDLFARSVASRGDALAVKDANESCSYRQLDARVGVLAGVLRSGGIVTGDPVVIYADRTVSAVVSLLAVMRAGGAFVPVSLETPPRRLDFILRDTSARLLLADQAGRARLTVHGEKVKVLAIEEMYNLAAGPVATVRPDDVAYIIYTSGTSGEPKGVVIEHGSMERRFHDWDAAFALSRSPQRVLQLAKLGFDVFVADVVKALCSGGTLVICPTEEILEPARLYRRLIEEEIDYVDVVPALLRPLVEYLEDSGRDLAGLGVLNCGADAWTKEEYERFRLVTRVPRLLNSYGVTECTVENTLFEDDGVTLARKATLPIGRALASDEILIVDDALQPVPPGVTGQLCIGGPCVARGYLNRPELDRRFFSRAGRNGETVRFYQTGDLGRADEDGVIEFLGRIDSQIKVNGHRIEVEEIERTLERVPGIRQAVVCFDGARRALLAFIRAANDTRIEPAAATAYLTDHLPPYMIPAAIVAVDQFPVTLNGKIDRSMLLKTAAAPAEPLETRAAHVVRESRSVEELCERLQRLDVDLMALVREFVKPTATFALSIGGAEDAAEAGPLPVLVVVNDEKALKQRRREVAGESVEYLPGTPDNEPRIRVRIAGVEVQLNLMIDRGAKAPVTGGWDN